LAKIKLVFALLELDGPNFSLLSCIEIFSKLLSVISLANKLSSFSFVCFNLFISVIRLSMIL